MSSRTSKSGSVLSELLIVLLILSFFFPVVLQLFKIASSVERFPHEIQDQIGLAQLRRMLNSCRGYEIYPDHMVCYNEKKWTLLCSDRHLYLSDGTIIVLADVNQVHFERRGQQIWMHYVRNNQWKEALIAYE